MFWLEWTWIDYSIMIALALATALYPRLAAVLNMVDVPNSRSSHRRATPTGFGLVLVVGVLLNLAHVPYADAWEFYTGFLLIAMTSFLDDYKPIAPGLRFLAQVAAVGLILYALPISKTNLDSPIVLLFALIFGVGMLNAYNFMDGINGMLLLHVLVVLGTLMSINMGWLGVERHHVHFIDNDILGIAFFVALLLAIVNARNQALGFIGDVGALGFAFIILYALYQLFAQTQNYMYFIFIGIFGIDTGCTIAVKLWRNESVTLPHRDFLFKRFVHVFKQSHLSISAPYALVQLASNIIVLQFPADLSSHWQLFWLAMFIATMVVFYVSFFRRSSIVKRMFESLFLGKKFLGLF
ncbi:MAG: hypothetical protein O3C22_08190 [Bacteroidetes bacterium]|nr:hypothetical protein [Bacteroidota bacterium]